MGSAQKDDTTWPGFLSFLELTGLQVPYFSLCFPHGTNYHHVFQIAGCNSTAIYPDQPTASRIVGTVVALA